MKMITKVMLGISISLSISGCTNKHNKAVVKPVVVTGTLERFWIDKPNTYICYYDVIDSDSLHSFSAIPPKALGKCTEKATVNLISKEVVWIVDNSHRLAKI